jgi:hypothetical protein
MVSPWLVPCLVSYVVNFTLVARRGRCDNSSTGKLGTLFSVKYVLVSVKLVCVYVKLLKT